MCIQFFICVWLLLSAKIYISKVLFNVIYIIVPQNDIQGYFLQIVCRKLLQCMMIGHKYHKKWIHIDK